MYYFANIALHLDDQDGLLDAILDMDRFQDVWWQQSLSDAAASLASVEAK